MKPNLFVCLFIERAVEGENLKQAPHPAQSPTQDKTQDLISQTVRLWPEPKSRAGCLTDWATQALQTKFIDMGSLSRDSHLFIFTFFMFLFIFERERKRDQARAGKGQRQGDTEFEAGSRLWADSRKPNVGLEPMNHEIMTRAEVGLSTNWATQAPRDSSFNVAAGGLRKS